LEEIGIFLKGKLETANPSTDDAMVTRKKYNFRNMYQVLLK
jgi:hypothetical protein